MNVLYKHVILTCAHTVRYAHTWSGMLPAHCGTCAGAGNRNIFFAHAHVSRQPGSRTPRLYSTRHTEAGALKHTRTQSQVHSSTHITQRQARSSTHEHRQAYSSTHEHRGRRAQAHTNTEPGALKHTHHTGRRTQVHTNTEAGALKHTRTQRQARSSTHEHRARCTQAHTSHRQAHSSTHEHRGRRAQAHAHTHRQTPVLVLTTDRTGIGTKWANVQTQAHTHHMHAHSST